VHEFSGLLFYKTMSYNLFFSQYLYLWLWSNREPDQSSCFCLLITKWSR